MVLDGEVMREIGEGGGASRPKPRAAPPSKIQCPRCNHWKHPRASTCKETGCDCECSKHQQGIKKKRQFAQITARDGLWDASVQRRLIHQAKFASELMSKSKVVYGIWTAYVDQTGLVKTAAWGSEPWVTQELCGKKGVVDLLWKTKATHFLGVPESGVDVYEPVTGTLHKYGLAHLTDVFTKNRVDAAAFTRLTEDQLERLGVAAVGDRAKLLEASQRMKETMPEVVAGHATARFEEDSHDEEDSHEEEDDGDEDGVDGLYGLRR